MLFLNNPCSIIRAIKRELNCSISCQSVTIQDADEVSEMPVQVFGQPARA
jgi:hypothetical protein